MIQRDLVVTCRNQKYHARSHRDYYELCYKEAHLQLHENHPIGSIIDDLPRYLDGSELVVPGTYAYEFIENFVEFNGRSNLEKYVTHRRIATVKRTRPTMAYKIIDFGNVYIGGFGLNISHELSTIFLSNVFVRRELLHNGFLLRYLSSLFREAPYNLLDRFVFFMQPHVKDSFAEITQQCNAKESPEMLEIAGLHPLYNAAFACSIDDLHEGFGALDDDDDEFGPVVEDDEEML